MGAVFIVAIASAYLLGRTTQAERNRMQKYKDYQRTRKTIDEAPTYYNADDAASFLHERIRQRNLRRVEEGD